MPVTSGALAAAPNDLAIYNGKYTFDRVGGYRFFDNPAVQERFSAAVRISAVRRAIMALEVTQPIAADAHVVMANACKQHACGENNFTAYFSRSSDAVVLCFEDSRAGRTQSTWYATGRPPVVRPIDCPTDLSGAPPELRGQVAGTPRNAAPAPRVGPPAAAPRANAPSAAVSSPIDRLGTWKFSQDPSNPEWTATAEITSWIKHGQTVVLDVRCDQNVIGVGASYGSGPGFDFTKMRDPQRTSVYNYVRTMMADVLELQVWKAGKVVARVRWNTGEGGTGRITPALMRAIVSADGFELHGGAEPVRFSNANVAAAMQGVLRQCRMRL